MAIIEFESGPQNYFEPGYFLGDYTEPNVGKAGLVCEPDYVVGFEISFGLYFVEGYLDEIYFYDNTSEFTVSAQCSAIKSFAVSATGYYEQEYFVNDYFEGRGASTELGCVATRIANSSVNLASVWSQSVTASGITKQSSVSLSTAVAQATVASKTVDASAAFVAAFAPTLNASALKNQTAIVAAVITMSTAASVTRSTNVLLEHIADLNAMAAMSAGLSASLSISATQTTSAVSIPAILITTSSTATLSCAASRIQPVSATISAVSGLTTSRYFGSSRPRNLSAEGDGFDFNNYFSGNQLDTSSLTGSEFIQFASNYGSIVPKANQSWVFSFSYSSLGTTRSNGFLAVSFLTSSDNNTFASVRTLDSTGTSWRLDLFKTGQATVSQTFTAGSSLMKIAVAYESGYVGIFTDNTRVALINLSSLTAVNWLRYNELAKPRFSLARNVAFDEFHFATGTRLEYNPQSSSVTHTVTQTNQAATTQALYHFTGNGLDDISVVESAAAALQSAFTQQTINTGTFVPRSAQASLQSMATVSAQGFRLLLSTADLSTSSTVNVLAGALIDSQPISINSAMAFALSGTAFEGTAVAVSVNTTLSADIDKIRGFASVQSANFAQSALAQRLRSTPVAFTAFNAITLSAIVIEATWDARTWIIGDKFPSDYTLTPRGIAVDDDNERVFEIYAYTQSGVSPDTGFYITERNDRDGNSQWQQSYKFSNGSFSVSTTGQYPGVQRISEPAYYDGHLYFAVRIVPSSGGETFRTKIYKYNVDNQTFVWTMTPHMQTVNVVKVYNGELYAVGGSTINDQVFAVIKFNTVGTIVWNKFIFSEAVANDIDFYGDHLYATNGSLSNLKVVKLATSNGALVKSVSIGNSTAITMGEIAVNNQGDVFVYGSNETSTTLSTAGFIIKLNTELAVITAKQIRRVLDGTTFGNSVRDIGFAADGDLILALDQGLMKVAVDLVTIKWIKRFVYGSPDQGSPGTRHIAIDTGNRFYWQANQVSLDQIDLSLLGRALQADGGLSFSNFAFRDGLERSGSPAEWTWNTWTAGAPFIQNITTVSATQQTPTFSSYTLNTTDPTIIEDDETLVDYLYFYVVSGIGTFTSQFTGNFIGGMFKGTDVALSSSVSTTANGTALRLANSSQNTAVTVNAVAHKTTDIVSAVNVGSTVTVTALVVRLVAAAANITASAQITAVKTTGIVSSVVVNTAVSATGRGIFEGQPQLAAIASNLTAAFKNATGTVLLETVAQMQITAEKNAVGVIQLAGVFTQSTDSADAKTVGVSSAIAAQATLSAEGLRILPAGANLSAQVTQTTNTDQSKITGVTAAFATTVTAAITAARTRSTPSTLSAVASIVCNNIVLREANANFTDSFDVLCSVQYIIRVTATFSAFNSQLTVGEIINIDPALQLMIEPETRIRKIQQETRVLHIESETRVNIIED